MARISHWLRRCNSGTVRPSYGGDRVSHRAVEDRPNAAGRAVYRGERGGGTIQFLRHELHPGGGHDDTAVRCGGEPGRDDRRPGESAVSRIWFLFVYPAVSRGVPGGRSPGKIPDRPLSIDRLLSG